MDTVIKRISEIEKAAVTVMDDAAARKKAFAAEMEAKNKAVRPDSRCRDRKKRCRIFVRRWKAG
mgnify:CR=1 FL=1